MVPAARATRRGLRCRGRRQALRPGRARHAAPGSRHESVRPGHGRDGHRRWRRALRGRSISRVRATSSARPRCSPRRSQQDRGSAAAGCRRRAARAPEGAHRARRGRDHQRHVQSHARQVHRARAPAGGSAAGRHRPCRRPRQAACRAGGEAAVRAQRQGARCPDLPFAATEHRHERPRRPQVRRQPRMDARRSRTAP